MSVDHLKANFFLAFVYSSQFVQQNGIQTIPQCIPYLDNASISGGRCSLVKFTKRLFGPKVENQGKYHTYSHQNKNHYLRNKTEELSLISGFTSKKVNSACSIYTLPLNPSTFLTKNDRCCLVQVLPTPQERSQCHSRT